MFSFRMAGILSVMLPGQIWSRHTQGLQISGLPADLWVSMMKEELLVSSGES